MGVGQVTHWSTQPPGVQLHGTMQMSFLGKDPAGPSVASVPRQAVGCVALREWQGE